MINLADDSESDSSDVDIAGCAFYQNVEEKKETKTNKQKRRKMHIN